MNKRLLVAATLLGLASLTACSNAGLPPHPVAPMATTPVGDYAEELCGALAAFPQQPVASRDAVASYRQLADASENVISTLKELGAPKITGGPQAHSTILEAFRDAHAVFLDALARATAVSDGPDASSRLGQVRSDVGAAIDQATQSLTQLRNQPLSEAFAASPACTDLLAGM